MILFSFVSQELKKSGHTVSILTTPLLKIGFSSHNDIKSFLLLAQKMPQNFCEVQFPQLVTDNDLVIISKEKILQVFDIQANSK